MTLKTIAYCFLGSILGWMFSCIKNDDWDFSSFIPAVLIGTLIGAILSYIFSFLCK